MQARPGRFAAEPATPDTPDGTSRRRWPPRRQDSGDRRRPAPPSSRSPSPRPGGHSRRTNAGSSFGFPVRAGRHTAHDRQSTGMDSMHVTIGRPPASVINARRRSRRARRLVTSSGSAAATSGRSSMAQQQLEVAGRGEPELTLNEVTEVASLLVTAGPATASLAGTAICRWDGHRQRAEPADCVAAAVVQQRRCKCQQYGQRRGGEVLDRRFDVVGVDVRSEEQPATQQLTAGACGEGRQPVEQRGGGPERPQQRPRQRASAGPAGPAGPEVPAGRPVEVDSRATPWTVLPSRSACSPTKASTAIPPSEWLTSTTGRSPAWSRTTARRSSPNWPTVDRRGCAHPLRPCPRWSNSTSRACGAEAALVAPLAERRAVPVQEDHRQVDVECAVDLHVQQHPVLGPGRARFLDRASWSVGTRRPRGRQGRQSDHRGASHPTPSGSLLLLQASHSATGWAGRRRPAAGFSAGP
jgi:hypothetical protein